jgi:NAD(P)-dependent dehydrogenase (short-subunit alcohol dehydrogenase family)
MTGSLEGRRAIVTGAGNGIGRASALLFAREGAKVLCLDRSEADAAEVARLIAEAGGTALAMAADAGDEAAVRGFTQRCVAEWGGIDIVFANAGISGGRPPIVEQTVDYWNEILRVNLVGPFLAIREAAPHMIRQGGGSIVLTASVAGLRAGAGHSAYAASKAGVISLAQTAANDFAGTGIRVNAICPGRTQTAMTKFIFDKAREQGTEDKLGHLTPLRRVGLPEEIAEMALFLASDRSSFVNGQAYAVDGGLTSTHPFAMS